MSLQIKIYQPLDRNGHIIQWQLRNASPEEVSQRVLPAFYFDIILPVQGYLRVDGAELSEPFVSPILLKNKKVSFSPSAEVRGYRFNPLYFKWITGIDPGKLKQTFNKLSTLLDQDQIQLLLKALSNTGEKGLAGCFSQLPEKKEIEVLQAAILLFVEHPELPIAQVARAIEITERWLQKLFKAYFNIRPGDLKKLVKFTHSISAISELSKAKLTDIAYDSHYFDQSHFIKNFKAFSGLLPSQFLQLDHEFFKVMNSIQQNMDL